ncbi:beta-2 adrenergic receptor [Nematostella vectensis]|uniref:beta-2 adrenergic receptor n=1 Tax=Nematostella vectensis TaxID=45351 RepID=UPI0020778A85|nr:beta-2 adrenergic receptor [Nematostella vectensis]XP_032222710.2 beta-2 adrenergic receptor [Nematostella vectensis]
MNDSAVVTPKNNLPLRTNAELVIESSIVVFIDTLAILGNLMVVVAFTRNRYLRTVTNTFIVTLSLADIAMAVFPMPLSASVLAKGDWLHGETLCILQGFSVHFLAFVSLQIMALTALNRYFKVMRPSQCRKVFTHRKTLCMVLGSCIFSGLALGFALYPQASQSFIFHPGKVICVRLHYSFFASQIYTIISSLLFVVLPAMVITGCYTQVFRKIRSHNKRQRYLQRENIIRNRIAVNGCSGSPERLSTANELGSIPQGLSQAEIIITRTLFGTVLGFFLCWVPCFVIDIVDVLASDWLNRRVYLTYTYLAYTSSAINPIIYGILNPSFRKEFTSILRCESPPR